MVSSWELKTGNHVRRKTITFMAMMVLVTWGVVDVGFLSRRGIVSFTSLTEDFTLGAGSI